MNPHARNPDKSASVGVELPRSVFRRGKRAKPMASGQPDKREWVERLGHFGMFARRTSADLSLLAEASRLHVYRADETIWREGERCAHVMFIEQGLAKAARCNRTGVRRTYGLYGPGDSMGIYAVWAGIDYPTDVLALNDGMTAILIDAPTLLGLAERSPDLKDLLLVELSRFTESFIRKIDILSAGTVAERLAMLMSLLIERYGVDRRADAARLPINLTLAHLSDIVDARIETVARVLSGWKRQGWLVSDGSGFHFTRLDELRALLPPVAMPVEES